MVPSGGGGEEERKKEEKKRRKRIEQLILKYLPLLDLQKE